MLLLGPPLSVAPLPSKYGGQFLGHGDYDEYRGGEMEDPYARVLYAQDRNKRFLNSQSASRIQSHQGITVSPSSIDTFYIVTYYIKLVSENIFCLKSYC